MNNPQNRLEAFRPVIERLGGKIHGAWFSFGEYDFVAIVDIPNNVNAVALFMATSAGGSVKAYKTTPLLTIEESMEAMKMASTAEYQPPR